MPNNHEKSKAGYVKIYRAMHDNPLFQANPAARHVFRDLIELAAWQDCTQDWRGRQVTLQRGQVMISTRNLAAVTGFTHQKIRTILRQIESHDMAKINTLPCNGPLVVTICNYSKYQSEQHTPNTVGNTLPTHCQHTKEEREEVKKKESSSDPNGSLVDHVTEIDPDLLGEIKPGRSKPQPIVEAFNAYNATAERCGLRQATRLSPGRRKSLGARLRESGMEGFVAMLANVERSAFLTGTNDREWRCDLDWLLKPANFTKVVEAKYGNGRHTNSDFDIAEGQAILAQFGLAEEATQ